jgi:putative transposase
MPSALKRYQESGDLHFLTFSCWERQPYFSNRELCELFEQRLEDARRRYVFRVFGYVVMPEHIHLLMSEPARSNVSRTMQALKTSISKLSGRHPFWLARYYDFNVHSESKRIEKLRYIHRNPVARGLVQKPERWKWSSFRHYLTGEIGTVEIESPWTAARRIGLRVLGNRERWLPSPP